MTRILRARVASRWFAIVAAIITIVACDGGPATTSTADSVGSGTVPAVGTATLSWVAPDENTDGSALTNLAGYRIYYGTAADALTQVVNVPTVGDTNYVIENLAAGT